MIFTLVSAAQDWMNSYSDTEKQRKQDDDNKRREKEMEAELVSILIVSNERTLPIPRCLEFFFFPRF